MGRLERHLDLDLIARIQNGTPKPVAPLKRVKPARKAKTYRAARRNAAFSVADPYWLGIVPTACAFVPPVRENKRDRSRDLIAAAS